MKFTADEIQALLGQSPSWALVDQITVLTKGDRARGLKLVSANDPLLGRSAAGTAELPTVVLLEALSQLAAVLVYVSAPFEPKAKTAWRVGIEKAKMYRSARPGERVDLVANVLRHRSNIWKLRTDARVDAKVAVEAELILSVMDRGALP